MIEGEPIWLPSGGRVDVVTRSDGTRVYAFRNTAVLTEPDVYELMRQVMERFNAAVLATGAVEHKISESGHSISVERPGGTEVLRVEPFRFDGEGPTPNKTGRSE